MLRTRFRPILTMLLYLENKQIEKTSTILRISGPDAYTYLQGQFTQALGGTAGSVAYGLWLNHKGRVLADSHILRLGEWEFLIAGFSAPGEVLGSRIEAYVVADDLALVDETPAWMRISVWADALEEVAGIGWPIPAPGLFAALPQGGWIFGGRRGVADNFEMLVPAAHAEAGIGALVAAGALGCDELEAMRRRIMAGIPAIPSDIGAEDLPAEGGLDADAVSYTKGCFLGQEILSRLKNLGQVRRALHVLRGTGTPPAAGTALWQAELKVGEIRTSAPDGNGFVAMAMLSLLQWRPAAPVVLAGPEHRQEVKILRRV